MTTSRRATLVVTPPRLIAHPRFHPFGLVAPNLRRLGTVGAVVVGLRLDRVDSRFACRPGSSGHDVDDAEPAGRDIGHPDRDRPVLPCDHERRVTETWR